MFIKLDSTGNVVSDSRYLDIPGDDVAANLIIRDCSNYVVTVRLAGNSTLGVGGTEILILKINSNFDIVWSRVVGVTGNETPIGLNKLSSTNYLVSGESTSFGATIKQVCSYACLLS